MRIDVIPGRELSKEHIAVWARIQESETQYASPCLRPELILAVAAYRSDVYVAVWQDASGPLGFFAFQRGLLPFAYPVAMCDYQAIVAPSSAIPRIDRILKACGLVAWDFSSLLESQLAIGSFIHVRRHRNHLIDLSRGFETYREELKSLGKTMRNIQTKLRLLERDFGEVRFLNHCGSTDVLRLLLRWRARRYSGVEAYPRTFTGPLESVLESSTAAFQGVLSALYVNNDLVAAHLGMRSGGTLHYWIPAFSPRFERYTPGWLLLYFLAKNCSDLGVQIIDLGPGDESYKDYFENASCPLAAGSFELPSLFNMARRRSRQFQAQVKRTPFLYHSLRPLVRGCRRLGGRL